MKYSTILIKYAEIALKGKNRYKFEDALVHQMKLALKRCEGDFKVSKSQGRIYVEALGDYDFDEAAEALKTVFGITAICPVVQLEDEGFSKLCEDVTAYVKEEYPDTNKSFKVITKRARKDYPVHSAQVNSELGGVLQPFPK